MSLGDAEGLHPHTATTISHEVKSFRPRSGDFAGGDGTTEDAIRASWCMALTKYETAWACHQALNRRADLSYEAVEAEAPIPDQLRRRDGGHYSSERMITEDQILSFDRKVELVGVCREWLSRRNVAEQKHGYRAAHEALDADGAWLDAFDALLDTPVPDLTAFVVKLRLYMHQVHCDRLWHHPDCAETMSEWLTSKAWDDARGSARLYQDALRLVGGPRELIDAQPFDREAWIRDFEALPGHQIRPNGPCFMEPEAWPDGNMSKSPLGAERWRGLAGWQREAVLAVSADRARAERREPWPLSPVS